MTFSRSSRDARFLFATSGITWGRADAVPAASTLYGPIHGCGFPTYTYFSAGNLPPQRAAEVSAPAADSAPQRRTRFACARASRRAQPAPSSPADLR